MGAAPTVRERGQAAVELALILPITVLLLAAVFVFGQAFLEVQQVSHAANEGARRASFVATEGDRHDEVTTAVREAAEVQGGRVDPAALAVAVDGAWTPGNEVTVRVTYPLAIRFGPVNLDREITRSRTMRVIQ